jgi:hypothetical protein
MRSFYALIFLYILHMHLYIRYVLVLHASLALIFESTRNALIRYGLTVYPMIIGYDSKA